MTLIVSDDIFVKAATQLSKERGETDWETANNSREYRIMFEELHDHIRILKQQGAL